MRVPKPGVSDGRPRIAYKVITYFRSASVSRSRPSDCVCGIVIKRSCLLVVTEGRAIG